MIEIDKNVPLPEPRQKYPWADMQVGDSFFVEGKSAADLSAAKKQASVKHGHKYTSKTEEKGVRVWRIK